ncbi:MAG: hypothetical protein KDC95_05510 [Planctomycetes bacterium]|nr:hypothetical protein [Planctomycetota bacterium]
MNTRRRTTLLSAAALLVAATTASAQIHTRTQLVRGNVAHFALDAASPNAVVLFGFTASGLGSGTCFPSPISLCLDVREPVFYFPPLVADASGSVVAPFVVPVSVPLIPLASQAITIDLRTTPFAFAKSNAIESSIVTLAAKGDEFNGTTLDPSWRIHNPHLVSASVSGGELHMRPTQSGPPVTWYADGEGPMLYKLVSGDFDLSVRVRSYDPAQPTLPPPISYRMGGITIRDPGSQPGRRNWLHIAVGGGTSQVPITVEDKTTVDSNSTLRLTPLQAARADIRAVRHGAFVDFYVREPNATAWRLLRSNHRPDLPATLQVGLNVFSWTSPNSVQASFDWVRFVPN